MKILYFHQYFSTPDGSAGTRSYSLARSLVEAGHQVQMVCLSDARTHTGLSGPFSHGLRRGLVHGIEVIEFRITYSNYLCLRERALVFLRYSLMSLQLALRSDADLVFATSTPLTAGLAGILSRLILGTPFVFEVRDLWPELPRAMGVVSNPLVLAALSALEWLSYHSADACIGLSPGICAGIAARGISPIRINYIPNACDPELFHALPQSATKQPELIGLSQPLAPGSFVATYAGAHGLANGLDSVIDAAAELQRLGRRDIQLVFIGDGSCKPGLQRRVVSEGLRNCHFLPPIPKLQLAKVLRHSVHVGLLVFDDVPAFYNAMCPNKFFDYLASGLPVLTNYPGWLADLISEHELGITVSPCDPRAFADALIQLADQPYLLASMSSNSRRLAETHFSSPVLSNQFRTLLETTAPCCTAELHVPMHKKNYIIFKALIDRFAAIIALFLLFPLLSFLALMVRLFLGPPVLFRQQRPGYKGRPFWLLKFRTMTNSRDASGALLPDSCRLNAFGKLLRVTSLDELPCLINILLGQMSFVGPRPFVVKVAEYEEKHLIRFAVRPGLTGWHQVNGRNSVEWGKKFELDCWYVRNFSFSLDAYILFKTLIVLFDFSSVNAKGHATSPKFTP